MRFITFEDFKAGLTSLRKILSLKADKSEVEKKANKSDVKHANLAQNNTREPDYVENRTHWVEEIETVIAEKQNVTMSADGSVFAGVINSMSGLNEGSDYIVEFNEKTYDCAGFIAMMQENAEQEYSLKVAKNSLGTGILEFDRDNSKILHEGDILLISGFCYYVNNEPEMTDTKMYVSIDGNPYVRTTDTLYKVKDGTAFMGVTAIGSVNVLNSKQSEFPFLIFDTGYETRLITKEAGTYSVGYTRKTEKVHTIDAKYLSDDTQNSNPDWRQVSPKCASYIENKPFGDTASHITITALNYGSGQLSEELSESETYSLIFRGELFSDCHFTNRNGDLGLYLEKYKLTLITVNGDKSKIRIRTARHDIEDLCISDIEIYKITGQKKIDTKYLPDGIAGATSIADWDENDETKAAYVKNRPFYDETELLATWIHNGSSTLYETIDTTTELMAGNKYIVSINDDEYIVTAGVAMTGWHVYSMCIGRFIEGFENVPFVIYVPCGTEDAVIGGGKITANFSEAESGSEIKLYKIINLVPIKERYFPNTIFSQKNAPVKFGDNTSSAIQGRNVTASGSYSHAEGEDVIASGDHSHAEGWRTESSGDHSHAEGDGTIASGSYSHAEGEDVIASGDHSHAEGKGTIADKDCLSASGMYNLEDGKYGIRKTHQDVYLKANKLYGYSHSYHFYEDTGKFSITTKGSSMPSKDLKNVYILDDDGDLQYIIAYRYSTNSGETIIFDAIHIWSSQTSSRYIRVVGNGVNGSSGIVRSNAHTLDWDGNAWFSGDVYVGSTSGTNKDDGSKKLATVDYVDQGEQEIWNQMPHFYTVQLFGIIGEDGNMTYESNRRTVEIMEAASYDMMVQNQLCNISCFIYELQDAESVADKPVALPCVNVSNAESIVPTPNTTFPIFAEFSANVSGEIVTVRMESEISFDADSKATISDDVITVTRKTAMPTPSTAVVGQVIKVKSIDSDGKILETEAVDLSTSVSITYDEQTGNLQIGG